MSWGPERLQIRCGRESPVEGVLGAPDELGIRDVGDKMWKGKPHPAEGALGTPSSFGDPLVTRCGRESQHSAES